MLYTNVSFEPSVFGLLIFGLFGIRERGLGDYIYVFNPSTKLMHYIANIFDTK